MLAGALEMMAGAIDDDDDVLAMGWKLMIPVVGPPLAVHTNESDHDESVAVAFAWISGIVQAMCLTFGIVGAVRRARALRNARALAARDEAEVTP